MSDQPGGKEGAGGGSQPRSWMVRLEQSAATLERVAEEVGPGVCLMSDAPQQSLRQEAANLRRLATELAERAQPAKP